MSANDKDQLHNILENLSFVANSENRTTTRLLKQTTNSPPNSLTETNEAYHKSSTGLLLGAGRVCQPAVEFLAFNNSSTVSKGIQIIVASLYLQDAEKVCFVKLFITSWQSNKYLKVY